MGGGGNHKDHFLFLYFFFFSKTRTNNNSTERTLKMTRAVFLPPQEISKPVLNKENLYNGQ